MPFYKDRYNTCWVLINFNLCRKESTLNQQMERHIDALLTTGSSPVKDELPEAIKSVHQIESVNAEVKYRLENELVLEIGLTREVVRRILHMAGPDRS